MITIETATTKASKRLNLSLENSLTPRPITLRIASIAKIIVKNILRIPNVCSVDESIRGYLSYARITVFIIIRSIINT
jgi:hypothetical protein